jgi:ribonuclease-3
MSRRELQHDAALEAARQSLRERLVLLIGELEIPRLEEALTHPSYANEARVPDNQRLEFLGDAVLELCVSELLVAQHPDADEGTLTRMRAALVNGVALAEWARAENIGECLAVGKGALSGRDREQTNVLSDLVEAIAAAIYDAGGLASARRFVHALVGERIADASQISGLDPKSDLQEFVQSQGRPTPTYRHVGTSGPQHEPVFEAAVFVGDEEVARGTGRSKRLAERAAAEAALRVIHL